MNYTPRKFLTNCRPGDWVFTNCTGFTHVGTVSENHLIYSNSRKFGGVLEVNANEFSEGRLIYNLGQKGVLPTWEVLRRAKSRLGERYDLLEFNCEHYNNYSHGLPVESRQIKQAIGAGLIAIGAAALLRAA